MPRGTKKTPVGRKKTPVGRKKRTPVGGEVPAEMTEWVRGFKDGHQDGVAWARENQIPSKRWIWRIITPDAALGVLPGDLVTYESDKSVWLQRVIGDAFPEGRLTELALEGGVELVRRPKEPAKVNLRVIK